MKLINIQSACCVIESRGYKLLCDPWLTDGVYYGSWFHFPKLKTTPKDLTNVDAIYVSHIHPDHYDPDALKEFNKNTPILIAKFPTPLLKGRIQSLGFKTIIEIDEHTAYEPIEGLQFRIKPHSNQLDSCLVIRDLKEGRSLVNMNDNIYEDEQTDWAVKHSGGEVDLLLSLYLGAGPYPQCFSHLSREQMLAKGEEKKRYFFNMLGDNIRKFKPKAVMPFAGTMIFAGKGAEFEKLRGCPRFSEAKAHVNVTFPDVRVVLLNELAEYDLNTGRSSREYDEPSYESYLAYAEEIKNVPYDYETKFRIDESSRRPILSLVKSCRHLMHQKQVEKDYFPDANIYIDLGQGFSYGFSMKTDGAQIVKKDDYKKPYLSFTLHYTLFMMILTGHANWNNAEIGGHITFHRDPDVFDRELRDFLYHFHF